MLHYIGTCITLVYNNLCYHTSSILMVTAQNFEKCLDNIMRFKMYSYCVRVTDTYITFTYNICIYIFTIINKKHFRSTYLTRTVNQLK